MRQLPLASTMGEHIVDAYIQWQQRQRNRAHGTLRVYSMVLHHYIADVVGNKPLDHVSLGEMEEWVQRERTLGRMGKRTLRPSAGTIARDVTILRGFYAWAHARGLIEKNPAHELHAPQPKNVQPRPIADPLWIQWWEAPLPLELRAVLALGYFGGLRLAELARLQCAHVVTEDGSTRIERLIRKGGSEHTISLQTGVEAVLRRLPALWPSGTVNPIEAVRAASTGTGDLLPWMSHYSEQNRPAQLSRWIHREGEWNSLPRFTPHQMRHSCATNLVRAGVPLTMVAHYMNHQTMNTTMRYARSAGDELREWLDRPL